MNLIEIFIIAIGALLALLGLQTSRVKSAKKKVEVEKAKVEKEKKQVLIHETKQEAEKEIKELDTPIEPVELEDKTNEEIIDIANDIVDKFNRK